MNECMSRTFLLAYTRLQDDRGVAASEGPIGSRIRARADKLVFSVMSMFL